MIFLIDAHLPKSICTYFEELGHEAIHTTDFPQGNATQDIDLIAFSEKENAVVITKDSDFYYSFQIHRKPKKLVMVRVGNMRLQALKKVVL